MESWTETWKALVSVGFGFFFGLIAEPLKSGIQYRIARGRAEKLLVDEINGLALTTSMYLATCGSGKPPNPFQPKANFNTERYDYVYQNERSSFYAIRGCDSLTRFYKLIKEMAATTNPLTDFQVQQLVAEFQLLENRIRDGIFGRRFRRALKNDRLRFLQDLVAKHNWKQFAGN